MKKKILNLTVILLLLLTAVFCLCSCSKADKLYGTWYSDNDGIRNALQFSANDSGDDVFLWVIYSIDGSSVESTMKGFYYASGKTLTLTDSSGESTLELSFELDGNTLSLSGESISLELTRYVLND